MCISDHTANTSFPQLRPIPDFPGYFADDRGNIWSERGRSRTTPHKLTPSPTHLGRLNVSLYRDGKQKSMSVHRLVALAWLGSGDGMPLVRHLDGNHLNNAASNLAWGTHSDNAEDSRQHGTLATGDKAGARRYPERLARGERNGAYTHPEHRPRGDRNGARTKPETRPRGERHGQAKLSADTVQAIRKLHGEQGTSARVLAHRFGIAHQTVGDILARRTWKHLP